MAGDWIAWVKGLTARREVVIMAGILGLSCREVAACCMEWWEWCDSEGDFDPFRDCHIRGIPFGENVSRCERDKCHGNVTGLSCIDAQIGVQKFGEAMAKVGWAVADSDGFLMHPGLGRWTGSAAKERLTANKRQKQHREKVSRKKRDKSVTREEKRREEKSIGTTSLTPLPPVLDAEEFRKAWGEFLEHRTQKRSKMTKVAQQRALAKLAAWGSIRAVAALEHSMANGYTGVFEPDAPTKLKAADSWSETQAALDSISEADLDD